jgi:nucleoside-diphosphate-sugar epimerase
MSDPTVLITGATGFIGRALARRWAAAGARVVALVKETPGQLRRLAFPAGVEVLEVDLRHAAGVKRAVQAAAPGLVVHLAAVGVTDPFLPLAQALRGNLDSTLNLLKAVGGRCRVLVARTPGEIECLNPYAASKAAAWQICRMFQRADGWPIVGVMPFQVYGPGLPERTVLGAALKAARSGEPFPMTPGDQRRDWIYVDDVVEGFLAAAGADANAVEGQTIELGTGASTPVREAVLKLFEILGAGQALVGRLPPRPGEVPDQVADAARAESRTGWRARVGLEEGLRCWVRALARDPSTD